MYNRKVPTFLHNRPTRVIDHCQKKIALCKQFVKKNIVATGEQCYKVESKRTFDTYLTDLGSPKCECHSWLKTKLPCKHMFAIINHTDESWTSFPERYRESVYMTLDEYVVGNIDAENGDQKVESHYDFDGIDADDESEIKQQTFVDIPKKRKITLTKFSECRELMREIISLTYIVPSSEESVSLISAKRHYILGIFTKNLLY